MAVAIVPQRMPPPKKGEDDDSEDDSDLINPNHVKNKMNISDLGAPRELSRKEREAKEKKEAQEKYWKVCHLFAIDERS